ncbi:hypothetical protein C8F01DRAFT_1158921, partial [Mycena amicta]
MDLERCIIPANPDVSGIGVRAAIYAQNLLCFAPVVAHLRDGHVSADEMKGVKDQSIGMLAIAFAILISTIIEATTTNITGQGLTRFHAAVILDLSWMNNTSTWIWFLLYIHHLTKPDPNEKTPLCFGWSRAPWTRKNMPLPAKCRCALLLCTGPGISSPRKPFSPLVPSTCPSWPRSVSGSGAILPSSGV